MRVGNEVRFVATRRYEELFQHLPVACLGFDQSGSILEWNRAAETLFRAGAAQLLGKSLANLFLSAELPAPIEQIIQDVFVRECIDSFRCKWTDSAGTLYYLDCSTFAVHGSGGEPCGGVLVCQNQTSQREYERQIETQLLKLNEYSLEIERSRYELEQMNLRLESLAATDGLTGLVNRRAFQESLEKELKRACREKGDVALIMIDVDNFKEYNDSFGHPAGDAVLKSVSDILMGCVRGSDIVARYGGEEFVVLLPKADLVGSTALAERMREDIETFQWPRRNITASFGVASSTTFGNSVSLLKAADQAMYASKLAGRNRVTPAPSIAEAA